IYRLQTVYAVKPLLLPSSELRVPAAKPEESLPSFSLPEASYTVMADSPECQQQQEEEEAGAQRLGSGPTHNPTAPPDEVFDVSTTVDPSYIISMIRKLIPNSKPNEVESRDGPTCSSKLDHMENDEAPSHSSGEMTLSNDGLKTMDYPNNGFDGSTRLVGSVESELSAREKVWEECGTILWDLAADQSHAELLVENFMLDVLLANLMTSDSARITEISLGIIGNLACHGTLMKQIISTEKLVEIIVNQVFSDDTPSLCEVCRLLTLGLQSSEGITWAKALQSDHILTHILWIADNTLNPLLIEKSVGLLLAILENQQDVAPLLMPQLVKFGLPSILINLLALEIGKVTSDRSPERYAALDLILRSIEALSTIDEYSQEICSNKEVLEMASGLIKLPDKIELEHCCVTAVVLIANILTDAAEHAIDMAKDLVFIQDLFDLFPFTSDDIEARNALWSIIARLLVRVPETEINTPSLSSYVMLLVKKTDDIEDDLLDNQFDVHTQNHDSSTISKAKRICRTAALKKISSILEQWIESKGSAESAISSPENQIDDKDVYRLLACKPKCSARIIPVIFLPTFAMNLGLAFSLIFV
ncbi:hypothetical protein V2J09_020951, partial [Rumex salicifolius]